MTNIGSANIKKARLAPGLFETAFAVMIRWYYMQITVGGTSLPGEIKTDVEVAIAESGKGWVTPHEEIQKRYKQFDRSIALTLKAKSIQPKTSGKG